MSARIIHAIEALSEWSGKIFAWLILPISLITFGEVILRYFFNSPTIWSGELIGYLFGVMTFMSGAYCLRYEQHIRLDLFRGRLGSHGKALLDIATSSFTYLFLIMLIWQGGALAWDSTQTLLTSGTVWNPPYWPFTWFLPLGALLVALQELNNLFKNIFILTGKEVSS
ncbi:MAG: TRAP transporter small permease subunit [Proteobacteria bacterium]|nr:TRAP transporter small permease subunit [Pseudomonadota bacterium]MBU2468503.1 TRAP transporter small permease subunit [Pseudomonadota bacterium]